MFKNDFFFDTLNKMRNLLKDKRGFWPYLVGAAIFLIAGFVLGMLMARGILPGQSLICP